MPDISMCMNSTCPSRNDCFRYRAEPNPYRQAYAGFKPDENEYSCDHFLDIVNWKGYNLAPKTD